MSADMAFNTGVQLEHERIIKLLEEEVRHLRQISQSIRLDPYMSREDWEDPDTGADYIGYFIKKLIKGETKPFLTAPQVEQMVDEMLEE